MTKRRILNLIPALLIVLVSCNEESPASSEFIIISNAESPINGIVSTYSYPSQAFEEEAFRFSSTTFRSEITAAVLAGDDLCIVKRDDRPGPDRLEVVNATTWTDLRSADLHFVAHFTRIASLDDKLFVAGAPLDGSLHLLVFNRATLEKVDSIYLNDYIEIREMIAHEDKIFISYNFIDADPKLLILSASTLETLDNIDLPDYCEDLIIDLEGNVMAFHRKGFIKINSSTLALTPVEFPEGNVFYGPGRSSFGFDRRNNIIYYFKYAAQPAPELFHLAAFNLNVKGSIAIPQEFIDGHSIDFDNTSGRIVIGALDHETNQGIIRLCNTNGKIIHDFHVPSAPLKIIMRK